MKMVLLYTLLLLSISITVTADNELSAGSSAIPTNSFTGFVSIFGDKIVGNRRDDLDIQFQYGLQDGLSTTTATLNNGFITTFTSMAVIATNGTAGSTASITSVINVEYAAGHDAVAFFTAAFTGTVAANTTQYIGILDNLNGFAVGFSGTNFGILRRSEGTDTFVSQSQFNGDTINGAGPSGFTYDRTKINVFRIDYGWLGAAVIKYQIMSTIGDWITFHTIYRPNTADVPSILNPFLPIQAIVTDTAGGNILRLQTASWNTGIIAQPTVTNNRYFIVENSIAPVLNTELHVLTVRSKQTFNSRPNKIRVRIVGFTGNSNGNSDAVFLYRLYKNATVTGTSYSNVNTYSVCEYSTTGTYVANSGTLVYIITSPDISNIHIINFPPEYNIFVEPGESFTLTSQALALGGGTNNNICSANWFEKF